MGTTSDELGALESLKTAHDEIMRTAVDARNIQTDVQLALGSLDNIKKIITDPDNANNIPVEIQQAIYKQLTIAELVLDNHCSTWSSQISNTMKQLIPVLDKCKGFLKSLKINHHHAAAAATAAGHTIAYKIWEKRAIVLISQALKEGRGFDGLVQFLIEDMKIFPDTPVPERFPLSMFVLQSDWRPTLDYVIWFLKSNPPDQQNQIQTFENLPPTVQNGYKENANILLKQTETILRSLEAAEAAAAAAAITEEEEIIIETIIDLPDDPLRHVMKYVGRGEGYFITGTCKQFRKVYIQVFGVDATKIFYRNLVMSKSRVYLYYYRHFPSDLVSSLENREALSHFQKIQLVEWTARWSDDIQLLDYVMDLPDLPDLVALFPRLPLTRNLWEHDQYAVYVLRNVAAKYGKLNMLKRSLQKCTFPWTHETLELAVQHRQLAVIEFILSRTNYQRDGSPTPICLDAATLGDIELMKCLWENKCPCGQDGQCILSAAENGYLDMLKLGVGQYNKPLDKKDFCSAASYNGHLHVLQWLLENGCPWDIDECRQDAENNFHMDIVAWIDENFM